MVRHFSPTLNVYYFSKRQNELDAVYKKMKLFEFFSQSMYFLQIKAVKKFVFIY